MRKEIENKEKIISKLSATLNYITNNPFLKDPTVALNNNSLLPETAPSNYNENILPSAGDCLQTIKASTIPSFSENSKK